MPTRIVLREKASSTLICAGAMQYTTAKTDVEGRQNYKVGEAAHTLTTSGVNTASMQNKQGPLE
jgi:hypothetical protein